MPVLQTTPRARKVWFPTTGWRFPPPRLVQLVRIAQCWVRRRHDWSRWRRETEDWFEHVDEPVPWAWRTCTCCGLGQRVLLP